MLEVIGAGNPEYKGQDWSEVWARSSENKQLTEEIESIIQSRRNKSAEDNDDDRREYAMPIGVQVLAVTKRAFVAYWRSPEYILVCGHQHSSPLQIPNQFHRGSFFYTYLLVYSTLSLSGI